MTLEFYSNPEDPLEREDCFPQMLLLVQRIFWNPDQKQQGLS